MAENDEAQEKTEEATPKRLESAREEGQIARSRELATTMILVAGTAALWFSGSALVHQFGGVMRHNLSFTREAALDPARLFQQLGDSLASVAGIVIVLLVVMLVMGILANVVQGGWLFSAKPMTPRLDRLNPIEGIKRMFSMNSLVELLKALAKFLLVATVATLILFSFQGALLDLGREALEPALAHAVTIILWSALGLAAVTIIIAAIDVPFQQFEHKKKLRMTRQQVRDEMKDTEGRPEVKGRVRQIQRQLATSRMMSEVPEADVIITNPEHFAVALRYRSEEALAGQAVSSAPVVVAKGGDQLALKIIEIGEHNEVPVIRSPLLARAIFFTTEIDMEIPEKLYLAVAQVLAFIHQVKARHRNRYAPAGSELRSLDQRLDVPEELHFDGDGKLAESAASS